MRTTERQTREGEPSIDDMRRDLAEAEAMNMGTSEMMNMLIEGFEGLDEVADIEIKEEWNNLFGKI
tara:strand:- start:176 stop:373 length:198 start_codon:yes stop_codon:yes gene_type:complete